MSVLVNQVKKFAEFCSNATGLEDYYYYKILFNKIQKNLVKNNPYVKNTIFEREVKKYYASYGLRVNPMRHSFYAFHNGIEDVRYIPENLYFGKIEPYYNKKIFAKAIDDKNYYDVRLDTETISVPYIFVRNIGGYFYNHDFELIDEDEANVICQDINHTFVIKPSIEGKGGAGVRFIENSMKSDESIRNFFQEYDRDFVIQNVVVQNGILHEVNPSSVNTVRFITFHNGKEIVMLSAIFRMGDSGARIDNISSGGIFCGIDEHGYIKEVAWNKKFVQLEKHPNGKEFKYILIPNYQNITGAIKRQQMRFGYFRILSWNVAISENNFAIIEFNITPQGIIRIRYVMALYLTSIRIKY